MQLLFAIGIQAAWEDVRTTLQPGEQLCAFVDDVYALCDLQRVKAIHDTLAEWLWRMVGIQLQQVKTKVWNKGRVPLPHVDQLGPEAWQPKASKSWEHPLGVQHSLGRG